MGTKTINTFDVVTTMANADKLPLWRNAAAATKAITYQNFVTELTASLVLSDYLKKNGTVALTGDWDIGSGRKISGDKLAARSASGLRLEDDGSNLGIFVADGGNVSVGSTTQEATSKLTVHSGNLSVVKSAADSTIKIISYRESAATHGRLLGSAARGTEASPAAVQTDDLLFNFSVQGYHSGGAMGGEVGYIAFHAAEGFTSSAQGCYMTIFTTPTGSATRAERMRISAAGNIGVNTTSPAISSGVGIDLNGSTIRLRTSRTPASAAATGNAGEVCWDSSFIYVCTATDTWKRVGIATW